MPAIPTRKGQFSIASLGQLGELLSFTALATFPQSLTVKLEQVLGQISPMKRLHHILFCRQLRCLPYAQLRSYIHSHHHFVGMLVQLPCPHMTHCCVIQKHDEATYMYIFRWYPLGTFQQSVYTLNEMGYVATFVLIQRNY